MADMDFKEKMIAAVKDRKDKEIGGTNVADLTRELAVHDNDVLQKQ